jgi:hypothetical protein
MELNMNAFLPLSVVGLIVRLHVCTACLSMPGPALTHPGRPRMRGERGHATTEYALVLLAAALVGLLVVAWATAGGGAERVGRLFNRVLDSAIERV